MKEMRRIRVGMGGMGRECGCGESAWESVGNQGGSAGNLGGSAKHVGNQGDDAGNEGGNLSKLVEMT